MALEITEFNGEGYMPLCSFGGWRVAIVNSCEKLRDENIYKLERHLKTDEVFILLCGNATLYTGKSFKKTPMEMGKIFNVKCKEWHCITMEENSKVAIVENDDTSENNTEYYYLSEE